MKSNSIWMTFVSLIVMGLIGACYSPPESFSSIDADLDAIEFNFVETESTWCGNGCEGNGCGQGMDPAVKLCFQEARKCRHACLDEVLPPDVSAMLERCREDLKACFEENRNNKHVCRKEFRICRHEAMQSVNLTEEQKIQLHECHKRCFGQLEACLEGR